MKICKIKNSHYEECEHKIVCGNKTVFPYLFKFLSDREEKQKSQINATTCDRLTYSQIKK